MIRFLADTADIPKESVEQHRKRECLQGKIREGKVLGGKKTIDKASNETINETLGKYKQLELNKTEKKREKRQESIKQSGFYRIFSGE